MAQLILQTMGTCIIVFVKLKLQMNEYVKTWNKYIQGVFLPHTLCFWDTMTRYLTGVY